MKAIIVALTIVFLSSCAYYAEYGYQPYSAYSYSTVHAHYTPSTNYYNRYRAVYSPINCENGLNQYEVLRIYPNRDGRPFNLKYDHFY